MIRRFGALVMVGLVSFAAGCGDGDPGPTTDTSTGGDTATVIPKPQGITYCTPAEGSATRSAVTCIETAGAPAAIQQPGSCTAGDSMVSNDDLAYPWAGATVGTKTFSCNACPNGMPELQGRFRVHGFQPDADKVDYSAPNPVTDYAWVLFVDGNTFYSAENDVVQGMTTQSSGYYFCSMKSENSAKHLYFVDLNNSNPDRIGQWSRTDSILSQNGGNNLLIKFFNNAANTNDASGYDYPFCRIGSTSDGQTCQDPFGG